jgi:tetratricopeptide (TPR) repeat protein
MTAYVHTLLLLIALAGGCVSPTHAEEQSGVALYNRRDAQDFVAVRRDASAILQKNPYDTGASFVIGYLALKQGQHAEALRRFRQALAFDENTSVTNNTDINVPHWRTLCLYSISETLRAMDLREEQLEVIRTYLAEGGERLEKRNSIEFPGSRREIEALIKLGRLGEASELVESRLLNPDVSQRDKYGWQWEKAVLAFLKDPASEEPLMIFNTLAQVYGRQIPEALLHWRAFLQLRRLEMDNARADYVLAAESAGANPGSRTNAWRELAILDLRAGSWSDGISTISKAWTLLLKKDADVRQDLHRDMKIAAGESLAILGYPDSALEMLSDTLADPARLGGALVQKSQWSTSAEVCRWLALDASRRLNMDRRDIESWWDTLRDWLSHAPNHQTGQWLSGQRALKAMADQLSGPLRPVDALSVTRGDPFLWLAIPRIAGVSASTKLLDELPLKGRLLHAYEPALRAEIAYRASNRNEAVRFAADALTNLPEWDVLVRARMTALIGIIGSEVPVDQSPPSGGWIAEAWRLHPATFLLAGESMPLRLEVDKSTGLMRDTVMSMLQPVAEFSARGPLLRLRLEGKKLHGELLDESGASMAVRELGFAKSDFIGASLRRMLVTPNGESLSAQQFSQLLGQAGSSKSGG